LLVKEELSLLEDDEEANELVESSLLVSHLSAS
jgi:hypothetical protein